MLMRTNFTLFWTYSRKSNENLCKGLLTCTSFYCDRKQWVWQLFNKLASQQHGLYIIPKHYIIIVGFERDDQGHACSYFMGGLVITCTYFGRWLHLGFKTIPNLNFQISCIFLNDFKFGTRVNSHMPNDDCSVLCQFGLKFSKKPCKN